MDGQPCLPDIAGRGSAADDTRSSPPESAPPARARAAADGGQGVARGVLQQDCVVGHTGFAQQRGHHGGFGRPVPADSPGGYEARAGMGAGAGEGRLDPAPEGATGLAIGPHGGAKYQDRHHLWKRTRISHRKQSGRRYNAAILRGAALGVGLAQGIRLNPRGTQMRFVSTRWALSAAGLLSALALAACSSEPKPAPVMAPPPPVVQVAPPPMMGTTTVRRHYVKRSKKMMMRKRMMRRHKRWVRRHRR